MTIQITIQGDTADEVLRDLTSLALRYALADLTRDAAEFGKTPSQESPKQVWALADAQGTPPAAQEEKASKSPRPRKTAAGSTHTDVSPASAPSAPEPEFAPPAESSSSAGPAAEPARAPAEGNVVGAQQEPSPAEKSSDVSSPSATISPAGDASAIRAELRSIFAPLMADAEKAAAINAMIQAAGAQKLTQVPEENLPGLLAEAKKLKG